MRTRERLGEAGVRLPCTGNLTGHFVFQSSFSKNKKGMLLLRADRGLRLRTHAHTPYMSFTRIRMHTHKHTHPFSLSLFLSQVSIHPSIHTNTQTCPVSLHVTSPRKTFLNELHLVPFFFFWCPKQFVLKVFFFGSGFTSPLGQTSAILHTDCPRSMAEADFLALCLEDAFYPTQHQIFFVVLIAYSLLKVTYGQRYLS